MKNEKVLREQLRQTQIQTILSEKRTILSELRTWVTMILLPLSLLTATLAIAKTLNIKGSIFFSLTAWFSVFFTILIVYFITKSIKRLFILNKKISHMNLP